MHVLIDGNNLLHAVWPAEAKRARPRGWLRLRLRLLDQLRRQPYPGNPAVTVVFDARLAPEDESSPSQHHGIAIRYSTGYPSADDLIEELIHQDGAPSQLLVVSNDRRLREAARRRGSTAIGCLDFYASLGRATPPPTPADEEPSDKPERGSDADMQQWLREFGDGEEGA